MVQTTPNPPHILPAYQEAFESKSRYLLLMGGAGSGKSYFAAQKTLHRMRTEPNHRMLVVRKVARTLRNSIYQQLKDVIEKENWKDEFKFTDSRLEMEHIGTGSTLITTGVDDPEKLKSLAQPTSIWVEEATDLSARDFRQIDLRLRGITAGYQQIICSFNPVSNRSYLYKEFYLRDNPLDTFKVRTTYQHNQHVGEDYERMMAHMADVDPEYYKIYALGEWGEHSRSIIYHYKTVPRMPDHIDETVYGLDFGYNNPCALVRVCHSDGEVYLEEVFYRRYLTTGMLIELLRSRIPNLNNTIYADSANPDKIKEIQAAGLNILGADKNVLNGINKVKEHRIFVVQGSSNLLHELENYIWKSDSEGNLIDEPRKEEDHACDAVRYAIYSHLGKRAKQSVVYGFSG